VSAKPSYVSENNLVSLIDRMDTDSMIADVVDPVSSPQRLEIMRTLIRGGMPYSALSNATGLKGGNLFFHLRKLKGAGMVVQNGNVYEITEKGHRVIRYLVMIKLEIGEDEWL